MKKRVRVYKPGGEAQQPTQQQIIDYIKQVMKSGDYNPETLSNQLTQFGISNNDAAKYIQYVSDDLYANGEDTENPETDYAQADDTQSDNTEASYAKYGGSKLTKGNFIKQYTKFAKMAQGGDTPSPGSDDVLDGRKNLVDGFLNAVTGSANDAALRQEAEAQYHYAYGGAKVGAFQEGGIHQEEIDPENFYHHLNLYGQEAQGVFADNQNIKSRQFGGFTDPNSGLYKFIGGGDNESADEEYQDSDIDFNQEEYARGGVPRRLSNRDLTARGYYSESGQKIAAPNTQGKAITSVEYLNKNIFGMPRQVKYNYGPGTPQPATPNTPAVNAPAPGEYTGPDEFTGRRQPLANFMMRTGIPGVRGLGAKMIESKQLPEYDVKSNDPNEIKRVRRFHPGYQPFSQNEEQVTRNYDNPPFTEEQQKYLTQSLRVPEKTLPVTPPVYNGTIPLNTAGPANTNFTDFENQKQIDQAKKIEALQSAQKEYGGPVDYTQYAYGGDISVPELYRAQVGLETNAFDPNANPLGLNKKDYKGDTVDFTGKVIKKRDSNFSFDDASANLKPAGTIDANSKNPLTGEKAGVVMNSEGAYTDDGLVDEAAKNDDGSYSQLFDVNKKNKGKLANMFDTGKFITEGVLSNIDEANANAQQNQMTGNLTSAESLFGVSNKDERGKWESNSGDIDPPATGSKINVKYGGGIYAMGGNLEDEDKDVEYMTEEQIKRFLAEGGELEYV
jgi:hypothetical protein